MKKRILSLIMAVCMVVLALPAFVLPTVAATKESFTTRLATNEPTWPTYESGVGLKNWNGNWTMGYFDAGLYYQHTGYSTNSNIFTTNNEWNYTGVFAESGDIILTQGPGKAGTGDALAFYADKTFKGTAVTKDEDLNKKAAAMVYTAPYTGTVELSLTQIMGRDRDMGSVPDFTKNLNIYFAIFLNGEMIWPEKGDNYADPEKWAKIENLAGFQTKLGEGNKITVDVTALDKIQFAVALAPGGTSFAFMQPTVTYQEGYSVVPETVTQSFAPNDKDWPKFPVISAENSDIKQTSKLWKMGAFNTKTGTFTPYTKYSPLQTGEGYMHVLAEAGDEEKPWDKVGGILLNHQNKALVGAMYAGNDMDTLAAYAVESVANGKATISLAGLALANGEGEPKANAIVDFEIYVNGTKKTSALIETNAQGALKSDVKAEVEVARGDMVVILANNFGSVSYVVGTPVIQYSEIQSFMHSEPTGENAIAVEKMNVEVNGSINLLLNAFATRNVYESATDVTLYIWDSSVSDEKTTENAIAALPMDMNMDLYSFEATYNGFAIKNLADELTVQAIVMDGETKLCESLPVTVNIAEVAYADYEAATGKMKTLYANLLNYAAYAQSYFNHNTDNLANKNLPEELKTLDREMLYDAQFEATKPSGSKVPVADSEIGSFTLLLENTLSIRAYIDRWETEMGDDHEFFFQYGQTLAGCLNSVYKDFPADENLSYVIDNIGAHEMSNLHYIRIAVTYRTAVGAGYRDIAYFGYTMTYSVESYASRMLESTELGLADLVRAMMEFGKSAAAVY